MKKTSPQFEDHDWAALSDEDLFQKRICDLKLRLEGTELEKPRVCVLAISHVSSVQQLRMS